MSSRIAVALLAAGTSSRMAGPNKLLCEVDGITLIERALRAALDARCAQVVVVTGWQADRVGAALAAVPAAKPLTVVRNADYASGLASSLRCAIAQMPETIDAALVQLADMPWIAASHLDRLIEAFDGQRAPIVVPVRAGRRGHPVLWPRRYFLAMCGLSGDVGARELLQRHASDVVAVPFDTDAIFEDIDTPDQLAGARRPPIGAQPAPAQQPGSPDMSDDTLALRRQFPLLAQGASALHYLDNAATGQIHESALDALVKHERSGRGNVLRAGHQLAQAATLAYQRARGQVAHFLNAASADEVVFTSGATAALNLVAQAYGALCKPGDEIVLSVSEHHSNLIPWQQLRDRAGVGLRFVPVGADTRLDLRALRACVGRRCRLVALTHASNVTGAVTDVGAVVEQARAVGARVLLDGAQRAPHGPVDVRALGVDFYAFSGHKCFGPGGVGVLWGRAELLEQMPPATTGGGMVERVTVEAASYAAPPRRFEAGTPPVAQAIGLGEALAWMNGQDWPRIERRMRTLTARLIEGLRAVPGLHLAGPLDTSERVPVVSFWLERMHSHDVCQVLDGFGVALRGGHHCAQPLMQALGIEGVSRASLALYNGDDDVDALLGGVREAVRILA